MAFYFGCLITKKNLFPSKNCLIVPNFWEFKMAVGKWKAARVPVVYTGSSYTGHARVMDYCSKTLTNIKNAILNFGNWTWNDAIHILDDSTVITGFGMAYTTMEYINGTKLWVAFTGFGVPLHYKCFSQVRQGKSSDTNGSMFPALVDKNNTSFFIDEEGGGWQAGLLMSLLPSGLNEDFGTPTIDSPAWFPTHATPICGYYGDYREAYARGQFRTAASTLTSPEQIFIINQDDCFMVLAQSANWGGATSGPECTFCPRMQGYITGRIFEATNSQDNQPYAQFGWLVGQFNAYRNNAGNRTDIFAWDARYGEYSNQCRAFYPYTLQSVTGSAGLSVSTEAAYARGGMGWFTAEGKRFNQTTGNTAYYLKGIGTGMGSYITSGFVSDQIETDPSTIHFYPMIAGTNVVLKNWNSNTRSPTPTTAVKGIIRRDLMLACEFKSNSETVFAQLPAQGAKLNNGNYIMGSCYIAFGWNPNYSIAETENLNPFRQHAKFYKDTSTTEIFGNNVDIMSMTSNSSGVYILARDNDNHPRLAKLSLGVTTNPTTYTDNTITLAATKGSIFNINNVVYIAYIDSSNNVNIATVNTSTMVPTSFDSYACTNNSVLNVSSNRGNYYLVSTLDGIVRRYLGSSQESSLTFTLNASNIFTAIFNNTWNDLVLVQQIGSKIAISRNSSYDGAEIWSKEYSENFTATHLIIDNADRIYIFGYKENNIITCLKYNRDGTFLRSSDYEYGTLKNIFFNKNENRFHLIGTNNDSSKVWFATLSLDGVFDYNVDYNLDSGAIPSTVIAENANDYVAINNVSVRAEFSVYKRNW
jgi:hypothetical protein